MKRAAFQPRPGQVDYTHIRYAPVINCVLRYQGKILVVKRSEKLNFYPGFWNGISGFLDDNRSLKQKIQDELREELGLARTKIASIQLGQIFSTEDPKHGKTWIVHPVLVRVKTDKIKLDWEAQAYRWLSLEEVKGLKLLPGFDLVLDKLSQYLV